MEKTVTEQAAANPRLTETIHRTQRDLLHQLSQLDVDSRIQWLDSFLHQLRQLANPTAPPRTEKPTEAYQDTQEWQHRFGQYLAEGFADQVTEHFHEAKRRALQQSLSSDAVP